MSRLVLYVALLSSFVASEGLAQPCNNVILGCPIMVDDFTQGVLPPANGPFEFTHVGLPPQSCVGGSRRVWINDVATYSAGMIALGGGNIAFQIQTEEHTSSNDVFDGANVVLDYAMPGPTDLTAGGMNDRLVLDVTSVQFSTVFVWFSVPGGASGKTIILNPGSNTILLSEMLVDMTQITRIRFFFHSISTSGFSELTISRIRVIGNGAKYLFLDLPILVEFGPPFPLPGPLMQSIYELEDGQFDPSLGIQVGVQSAEFLPISPIGSNPFPVEMRGSDSALRPASHGLMAGFEFFESASFKTDHREGAFELSVVFENTGRIFPGPILLPELVEAPNRDVFYIPFEVETRNAFGAPAGSNFYRIRVEVAAGAAYDFGLTEIYPTIPNQPNGFNFGFELRDDGTSSALMKAPGQALFNVSIEGDQVPPVPISTAAPLTAVNGVRLSAAPMVVSDRTQLRLSRALDQPATLRVYDLAGRLIRRLELPLGQQAVSWDTVDDRGRSVASGVYVARLSAANASATARVVVVR